MFGMPFSMGDHIRYVGKQRELGADSDGKEVVLVPGMTGVIIASPVESPSASNGWHCQVQFPNGYQLQITPANAGDFEPARTFRPLATP